MKGIILAGGTESFINKRELHKLTAPLLKSGYGEYLLELD